MSGTERGLICTRQELRGRECFSRYPSDAAALGVQFVPNTFPVVFDFESRRVYRMLFSTRVFVACTRVEGLKRRIQGLGSRVKDKRLTQKDFDAYALKVRAGCTLLYLLRLRYAKSGTEMRHAYRATPPL
eukprot:336481-Rhodomonas_salina.1